MRRSRSTLLSLPSLSALILSILVVSTIGFAAPADRIGGTIAPQQLVKLPAGVPLKAKPQFDQGPVDPSFRLSYITLLTVPSPSQQKAIDQLLAQQQDPHSPLYHQWITPEQYADQFGLSSNDVAKITTWLTSQGFTVIKVARSRNLIAFSGTAGQAEYAFHTAIHNFRVDGESHFSNTTAPSIPTALSGIVGSFGGLNNFRPHPMIARPTSAKTGARPFYYDSTTQSQFLAPADFATIYDVNALYTAGINGSGQTLAVIGQTDVYLADLVDFRNGFSLPSISGCSTTNGLITSCDPGSTYLQYVLVNGDPGSPSLGDLIEADLDLEWSGAVASSAQLIYVNAPDPNGNGVWDAWHAAVTDNTAPVITMSYGLCELGENDNGAFATDEALLKQANMQGITFMNSSGDQGAAGCDPPQNNPNEVYATLGLAVSYPASSPEVTGVGGTMIPLGEYDSTYWNITGTVGGSALGYIPENGWNDAAEIGAFCAANPSNGNCGGISNQQTAQAAFGMSASGGGPSNCYTVDRNFDCSGGFTQPAWQSKISISGQTTPVRFVPDLALLASPNFPGYILCTPVEELSNSSPYDTETTSSCATGIAGAVDGMISGNTYVVGQSIVGGTSASTPTFAGIVTLLNQYVVKNDLQVKAGLGNINPNLYGIATNYDPHATAQQQAFNQVTAGLNEPGSNTVYCVPGSPGYPPLALECPAAVSPAAEGIFGWYSATDDSVTHYNLVTGLGSVDANNLFTAWSSTLTPDFVIAVTATPSSTLIGTNVTWNGTLTATDGYNKSVTLTCGTGAPTTCTISPSSITPTAAGVAFTVTAGNATAGTFTFNIQGTDGTITNTQSVTLAVNRDFAIPGTLSNPTAPNPGQSTTTTMLVTPNGGSFTGNVTFACSAGLPTGATCSFVPPQISAGTTGAVTVTVTIQTAGPFTGTAGIQRRATIHKITGQKQPLWIPFTLPLAGIVLFGLGGSLPRRYRILGLCLALAITGVLVACGGGGSGTSTPPVTTVSPSSAQVQLGATQQFTASSAVTWSLSSGAPGTISSSGLYTAPATGTTPVNFTVVGTPTSGSAGSAAVNLLAVGVTATPGTASLYPSLAGANPQTEQFSAAVTNSTANQSVTWAVTGGSANGTVTASGLYTAPATLPGPSATVTATSAADPSKVGSATVNFRSPTPAGSSTITVSAAEGSDVHTTSFSLTVN